MLQWVMSVGEPRENDWWDSCTWLIDERRFDSDQAKLIHSFSFSFQFYSGLLATYILSIIFTIGYDHKARLQYSSILRPLFILRIKMMWFVYFCQLKSRYSFFFFLNKRNNSQVSGLKSGWPVGVVFPFRPVSWTKTRRVKERGLSSRLPIQHGGYGGLILWDWQLEIRTFKDGQYYKYSFCKKAPTYLRSKTRKGAYKA